MGKKNRKLTEWRRSRDDRELMAAWKENGRVCPKCGEKMEEKAGLGPKQPLFHCGLCGKYYSADEVVKMFRPSKGVLDQIEGSK